MRSARGAGRAGAAVLATALLGCGAKGPAPAQAPTAEDHGCRSLIADLERGEVAPHLPLPSCAVADVAGQPAGQRGDLGTKVEAAQWQLVTADGPGRDFKLWHRAGSLAMLEISGATSRALWPALQAHFGATLAAASQKLPYWDDLHPHGDGQWVFADLGVALLRPAADAAPTTILLFPPTTSVEYAQRLAIYIDPPSAHSP